MKKTQLNIRVSIADHVGRCFLKTDTIPNYYKYVDKVRSLLESKDWEEAVNGYYINNIDGKLRLSYFVPPLSSDNKIIKIIKDYIKEKELGFPFEFKKSQKEEFVKIYGGDELLFRIFLSIYSLIGLDIMQVDLLNARCLFVKFRWQIVPAGKPYKSYFEKVFLNQSPSFNLLSSKQKKQFWDALEYWSYPNGPWAHMMVNMILGKDWIWYPKQSPLSNDQINKELSREKMGLQL